MENREPNAGRPQVPRLKGRGRVEETDDQVFSYTDPTHSRMISKK